MCFYYLIKKVLRFHSVSMGHRGKSRQDKDDNGDKVPKNDERGIELDGKSYSLKQIYFSSNR